MTPDEQRRFGIADSLILVAGLAAGLGLVRAIAPDVTPGQVRDALVRPREGWSLWYAYAIATELGAILVIPFVAGWTPACLLVQMVGPRPRWRRLRRQPGFVACLIATVVVAVTLAVALACLSLSSWVVDPANHGYLKAQLPGGIIAGSGVLWGWVAMRLCGVCRPSRTWTDRLGRMIGAVWVALGAISVSYVVLTMS